MNEFVGKWLIESMETWTQEFVNLHEPGYFEFDKNGLGSFLIGSIHGVMDLRVSPGEPLIEFSWLGGSEGSDLCGRGIFHFSTPDEGHGTFFIHTGGQSAVSIRRET